MGKDHALLDDFSHTPVKKLNQDEAAADLHYSWNEYRKMANVPEGNMPSPFAVGAEIVILKELFRQFPDLTPSDFEAAMFSGVKDVQNKLASGELKFPNFDVPHFKKHLSTIAGIKQAQAAPTHTLPVHEEPLIEGARWVDEIFPDAWKFWKDGGFSPLGFPQIWNELPYPDQSEFTEIASRLSGMSGFDENRKRMARDETNSEFIGSMYSLLKASNLYQFVDFHLPGTDYNDKVSRDLLRSRIAEHNARHPSKKFTMEVERQYFLLKKKVVVMWYGRLLSEKTAAVESAPGKPPKAKIITKLDEL